ncbi:PorT family protein [uncultured Mucilaginibacter sp.]|uniref:outer membrane beta-barrel protein n=1 Tax=uncultured Mucilaginibacter sp. TaxID=797541 RepID=UPI0025EA702D|nr:PorT family protein [uncultured Mucilaginibacter sp.]
MKHLIITAIFCGMLGGVYAQNSSGSSNSTSTSSGTDTTVTKNNKKHKNPPQVTLRFSTNDNDAPPKDTSGTPYVNVNVGKGYVRAHRDSLNSAKHHGFSFGLAFFPFDLGLALPMDNGSFTFKPQNQFLNYSTFKTTTDAFNVLRFGYRFSNNFRVTLGAGLEWTLIRLQNDSISTVNNSTGLTYKNDGISYSKNRLSSEYLTIPLSFDYRSTYDKNGNRFHLSLAPQVGFLIDGMLKQISSQHGKTHNYNDFHFAKFEYGGILRLGYGDFGIFTKYYFNDMFVNSPNQAGIKSFSFGLSYGW